MTLNIVKQREEYQVHFLPSTFPISLHRDSRKENAKTTSVLPLIHFSPKTPRKFHKN